MYKEELITFQTEDKLELDGLLARPLDHTSTKHVHDLVLMIHGLSMNFYNPFYMSILPILVRHGYTVLSVNNRGHDLSTTHRTFNDEDQGAVWETFPESALDLKAAVAFARSLGYQRIALMGHSLGGLKAVYYQSVAREEAVHCLILISPVRSMKGVYKFRLGDRFDRILQEAEDSIQRGLSNEIVTIYPAWPYALSRNTIISFMAEESQANIYLHLGTIAIPILLVLDSWERPYDLSKEAPNVPRLETIRMDGADHFYTGRETDVADAIVQWLADL